METSIEKTKPENRDYVTEFKSAYLEGMAGFFKASKTYVDAIDEDPKNRQLFREEFVGFSEEVWRQYEELGRGLMHFGTITSGKYKSKIRKLVYSTQKEIADGKKFELLLTNGDVLMVDLREITTNQSKQLYANGHIRNISEQKSWLSENPEIQPSQKNPEPLPIICKKGKVIITKPTILTKKQIDEIRMQI